MLAGNGIPIRWRRSPRIARSPMLAEAWLHGARPQKSPAEAGLSQPCGPPKKEEENAAHTETIPQKRLHRSRPQKKPRHRRAGLKFFQTGLAELRHPANPSRQYHSCARPQKKPRRSGAKFGRSIVMGLPCEAANPSTQRGRRIIGCTPRLRTRVASVAAPLR
jgi:hypothetical protein